MATTRERLNRYLARRGWRPARSDSLIDAGRVTVNGARAALGASVDPQRDRVSVDGRPVAGGRRLETLMLNKPAGVVTTVRDPHRRPTVMGLLPEPVPGLCRWDGSTPTAAGCSCSAPTETWPTGSPIPATGGQALPVVLGRGLSDADVERLLEGVELEDGLARPLGVRRPSPERADLIEVTWARGASGRSGACLRHWTLRSWTWSGSASAPQARPPRRGQSPATDPRELEALYAAVGMTAP